MVEVWHVHGRDCAAVRGLQLLYIFLLLVSRRSPTSQLFICFSLSLSQLVRTHAVVLMRLRFTNFAVPVLSVLLYGVNAEPSQAGDLYPPGYLPLVNKANAFLSVGQFNDAAKAYTEALGGSGHISLQ